MDGRASRKRKSSSGPRAAKRTALHPEEPNDGVGTKENNEARPIEAMFQEVDGKDTKSHKEKRVNRHSHREPYQEIHKAESSKDGSRASSSPQNYSEKREEKHSKSSRKSSKKRKASGAVEDELASPLRLPSIERKKNIKTISGAINTSSAANTDLSELLLLRKENARLQKELSSKDHLLTQQKETISYIYGQCTCTVCMELVWRPHVLSPCGHVFCARCLVAWFTRPAADEYAPHMEDEEQQRAAERRRTLRRVKVCPHCREKVSVAPAEVWLIKGLVEKIDWSMRNGHGNDEHLVRGEESFAGLTEEATREAKGGNLPASKNIWIDIFIDESRVGPEPMFDEEDRVYRCTFCANEVVNGVCTSPSCGMLYNIGHLLAYDSEDDESFMDEEISDDDPEELGEIDSAEDGFINDAPIEVSDSEDDDDFYARHDVGELADQSISSSSSSVEEITGPHRVPRLARQQISSDLDSSSSSPERDSTHITIGESDEDDDNDDESEGEYGEAEDVSDESRPEEGMHGELEETDDDNCGLDEEEEDGYTDEDDY